MYEQATCEAAAADVPSSVVLARRVARLNEAEMQTFARAYEESKREGVLDRPGKGVPVKETEAPGVQKWLGLVNERTSELFQEIYTLENELRPLLRVMPGGVDAPNTSSPDPFLVVDHLALHHNALSMAAALLRNVRQRLQL